MSLARHLRVSAQPATDDRGSTSSFLGDKRGGGGSEGAGVKVGRVQQPQETEGGGTEGVIGRK